MFEINWTSFSIGFLVALVLSNIAQLIIAYRNRQRAREAMARLNEKSIKLKEQIKSSTDDVIRSLKENM